MDNAKSVLTHARRLRGQAAELQRMEPARIVNGLYQAATRLSQLPRAQAVELRLSLQRETGLSLEMIEWGLDQACVAVEPRTLGRLLSLVEGDALLRAVPAQLTVAVLASNVFSAPLRTLVLSLLSRSPLLVKAPHTGSALLTAFIDALDQVDEALADHVECVVFPREAEDALTALLSAAEAVHIYGDDSTVAAVRRKALAGARVLAHGHGISAAYVPRSALVDDSALRDTAQRLALDVTAYDQLGCLSPQLVMVQGGGELTAFDLLEALHRALGEWEVILPRGTLPRAAAAAIVQWRGVAAARGELRQAMTYACSLEQGSLRAGPGYRHVGLYHCGGAEGAGQALQAFGHHLKSIGVAGPSSERAALALALPPGLAPRLCALGTMQTPPLTAYFDGQSPLFGIQSFIQID